MSDGRSSMDDSLDLQTAKRELLANLLKQEGIELRDPETIYPRQSSDRFRSPSLSNGSGFSIN